MDEIKTVDNPVKLGDPLLQKQKEDVSKMRASLLSCTDENGISIRQAMQSVTAMRVYHQLTRIIRYTELMDKLENKLYESIEYQIDTRDVTDTDTMIQLMTIQSQLQKTMIESHKLLEPYLNIQDFTVIDLAPQNESASEVTTVLNPEDRDRLRSNAQAVLNELAGGNNG